MRQFLIVNPSSGTDSPSAEELRDAARARGVEVRFLDDGDDLQELARRPVPTCSGWPVATARWPPLRRSRSSRTCRSSASRSGRGTTSRATSGSTARPVAAPAAFSTARGKSTSGARVTALPQQSRSVSTPDSFTGASTTVAAGHPGAPAGARATVRDHGDPAFTIDGEHLRRSSCSSPTTRTRSTSSLGERERLDEGKLHLYIPDGFRWITSNNSFVRRALVRRPAAPPEYSDLDGPPVKLDTPVRFRMEPLGPTHPSCPRAPGPG